MTTRMQARWLARMAYSHIKASVARQNDWPSLPLVNCKKKREADPWSVFPVRMQLANLEMLRDPDRHQRRVM